MIEIHESIRNAKSRGNGELYAAHPAGQRPRRWVLGVHGSSRSALSYRDVPFYRYQRDLALDQGLGFAAISLGADVWGRPEGLNDLALADQWLHDNGQEGALALWASSAGGSLMFFYARRYRARVSLLLGTFPVWDLEACAGLPSCQAAWSAPSGRLPSLLRQQNPARFPPPSQPLIICQGTQDSIVPPTKHAQALAALRPILVHETDEGHSTAAWKLYETPLLRGALRQYAQGK